MCRYMAANERCKSAEQTIQRETRNMEQLSKAVDEKFKEVSHQIHINLTIKEWFWETRSGYLILFWVFIN